MKLGRMLYPTLIAIGLSMLLVALARGDEPAAIRGSAGFGYTWESGTVHLAAVWFPRADTAPGESLPFAVTRTFYSPTKTIGVDWLLGSTEGPESQEWVGLGITFNPPQLEAVLARAFALAGLADDISIRLGLAAARIGDNTEFGLYVNAQIRLLEF